MKGRTTVCAFCDQCAQVLVPMDPRLLGKIVDVRIIEAGKPQVRSLLHESVLSGFSFSLIARSPGKHFVRGELVMKSV